MERTARVTVGSRNLKEIGLVLLVLVSIIMNRNVIAQGQQTGSIKGIVYNNDDKGAAKEPVIGASVMIEGTKMGAATDLDGKYVLTQVPVGTYRVIATSIGYSKMIVQEVRVEERKATEINIPMRSETIQGNEVTVEAKRLMNNDASMLTLRKNAEAFSDAISAQAISRSGSGDAAAALSHVTGASVVGGKYVAVRGLDGRYSNTMLNGALLPSTDPDKPAVQMDLIPTNLLDNIVVQKSFTPDKPGNFTGGNVNLNTKDIPDRMTLSFSTSTAYNSISSLKSGVPTQSGGSLEWLGFDNGYNSGPVITRPIPDASTVVRDSAGAKYLSDISKSFNNEFGFKRHTVPLDRDFALSYGNQYSLKDRPLGVLASLSYRHNNSYYDDGVAAQWEGDLTSSHLSEVYQFNDVKAVDEVLWGALGKLTYKPSSKSLFSFNYNREQNGEKTSRHLAGPMPLNLGDALFETRVLQYTVRSMQTFQLTGQHSINALRPFQLDWRVSSSKNTQDDPDLRYFSDTFSLTEDGDTLYDRAVTGGTISAPLHVFRYLDESNHEAAADFSVPFSSNDAHKGKIRFGGSFLEKKRTQSEQQYLVPSASQTRVAFRGDPNAYFADSLTGIIGTYPNSGGYIFGNIIVPYYQAASNYHGTQRISSAYLMTEVPLSINLNLIAGLRTEKTSMDVISESNSSGEGRLNLTDVLPSLNLIYRVKKDMNLRGSFSITVARPTIREMAPFYTYEFVSSYRFIGNPKLTRTKISNYDLRWELFARPGEVMAVSLFYKKFNHPIEQYSIGSNEDVSYQNTTEATVAGSEFEVQRNLGILQGLGNFQIGGNVSLTYSRVALEEGEYNVAKEKDPNASRYRRFEGQSPYVVDLHLNFDNTRRGTTATIVYNVFGKRLYDYVYGYTPSIYELPRNMIDVTVLQRVIGPLKIKAAAKNLLNEKVKKVYDSLDGKEYIARENSLGHTYSVGLSYEL